LIPYDACSALPCRAADEIRRKKPRTSHTQGALREDGGGFGNKKSSPKRAFDGLNDENWLCYQLYCDLLNKVDKNKNTLTKALRVAIVTTALDNNKGMGYQPI